MIDECRRILRMRQYHGRRPRYFYLGGEDYAALVAQAEREARHLIRLNFVAKDPYPCNFLLFGLEVVPFDFGFPQGYVLASETRLH